MSRSESCFSQLCVDVHVKDLIVGEPELIGIDGHRHDITFDHEDDRGGTVGSPIPAAAKIRPGDLPVERDIVIPRSIQHSGDPGGVVCTENDTEVCGGFDDEKVDRL